MDITKLSDIEIKSMAYDAIATIEGHTNNLKILNAELENRRKTMEPNTNEEAPEITDPIVIPEVAPEPEEIPSEEELQESHIVA